MRLNVRKLTLLGAVIVIFYLLLSYASVNEVPGLGLSKNVVQMEKRLENLKKQVDNQLTDSSKLLEKVKHLQFEEYEKSEGGNGAPRKEVDLSPGVLVLPVLVIACDRVTVKRCLENLVKFRPNKDTFPIIVSQDCGHNATYEVIRSFVDVDPSITVVRQPDLSEIPLARPEVKFRGYYKIARHYKFALNHVFKTLGHEAVIIVEDDLDISQDFFEYFLGTYPLLIKDPSLWCISAWNDNGKKDVIDLSSPELLHRTDFFPGLGWTLRRHTWLQLEPHWPKAYFDDWLRNPVHTQGRACIRPEIPRTYTFGKKGVSQGLYYDMQLRAMHLNTDYVEFTKLNLTYLLKENYDEMLTSMVYSAPEMSAEEAAAGAGGRGTSVRVTYHDAKTFQRAAKKLRLMEDFRSGVPRTAYRGIVTCYVHGRRVFLAPSFEWTSYDPSWG